MYVEMRVVAQQWQHAMQANPIPKTIDAPGHSFSFIADVTTVAHQHAYQLQDMNWEYREQMIWRTWGGLQSGHLLEIGSQRLNLLRLVELCSRAENRCKHHDQDLNH